MAGNDQESAPLDTKSDGDMESSDDLSQTGELPEAEAAPAESASGLPAADEAPASSETDSLTPLVENTLLRIREALEQKDFQTIAGLIGLDSVFINGHPEPTASIVANLGTLTENLCDFEGVLLRVQKNEVGADRGRFSLRFRIMWSSCDDWEEYDLYLDAHVGYARTEEGWKIQYLSLSQAQPPQSASQAQPQSASTPAPAEPAPAPQAAAPSAPTASLAAKPKPAARLTRDAVRPRMKRSAAPSRPLRAPRSAPPAPAPSKPAEQPLTDEYFSQAAAQYFGQVGGTEKSQGAEARPVVLNSSAGGKHHLLYVPVVMHEELIRKILSGD